MLAHLSAVKLHFGLDALTSLPTALLSFNHVTEETFASGGLCFLAHPAQSPGIVGNKH